MREEETKMTAFLALGVYLALSAAFYSRLTATAADMSLPAPTRHSRWHRARVLQAGMVRRLQSGLRLPKRTR